LTICVDVKTVITAYQKRFNFEEMFRGFKSGAYLSVECLSKLLIIVAIDYTSATLQGQKIKKMGIQKFVAILEKIVTINAATAVFTWSSISITG
jgi:phage-related holin